MSNIHRTSQWVLLSKTWRPRFQALINQGGVRCRPDCQLGGVILPGQKWDLGHIIDAAINPALAYEPMNLRPEHQTCNRSAGGKAALAKRNSTRQQALPKPREKWNKREW